VWSEADLVPGRYGIREPVGDQPLPHRGDGGLAVFVPGVAFDRNGNRLGRGKGWYDRLLAGLDARVPRIALAYEFQLLEEVPVERGDLPVHTIVTEKRVIACGSMEDRVDVAGG
jgi:5-formyltetrahydrofolate cyclo-ligase